MRGLGRRRTSGASTATAARGRSREGGGGRRSPSTTRMAMVSPILMKLLCTGGGRGHHLSHMHTLDSELVNNNDS